GVSPGRWGTLLPWLADPWSEAAVVWSAGATLLPVLPAGWVLTLFLVTGAPGYWFRPGNLEAARQDRAVALSRYACGALAWLAMPVGLAAAAVGMTAAGYRDPPPPVAGW